MNNSKQKLRRYGELPGVKLDQSQIPASLCPLLPFAKRWAILSDDGLEQAISEEGYEEIVKAVEAARPLKSAIHEFAYRSAGASATPVPDEVVLFQMFAWSLNRLEIEVSDDVR